MRAKKEASLLSTFEEVAAAEENVQCILYCSPLSFSFSNEFRLHKIVCLQHNPPKMMICTNKEGFTAL